MLKNLYGLRLESNQLGSGIPRDLNFINSFNNISSLRFIGLYSNNFGGVLPNSIVNLSLQHFTIGNNRISGNIPGDIGNLINLTTFGVAENDLTGVIPNSIS